MLWVLAALYVDAEAARSGEPGMGWFAAAMALLALFVGHGEGGVHLPSEPVVEIDAQPIASWYLVVLAGTWLAWPRSLASYVGLRGARARPRCCAAILGAAAGLRRDQPPGVGKIICCSGSFSRQCSSA